MSSDAPQPWTKQSLGDLISVEHGYAFKTEHFADVSETGNVVVSVGNFEYTGGFRFARTATRGYAGEFPERFRLSPGDILLVMTCQTPGGEILGIPGRIPADGLSYLHNQRLGKVVFRGGDLEPRFAYWLFSSPGFNRHLVQTASGSKILHTAPERIKSYLVDRPPLTEQLRIASMLDALDDKIDSNRRLAALLEATAATSFRARFVDFVGVELCDNSAIGPIPRGWSAGSLSDITRLHREFIKGPSELPYIGLDAMPRASTVLGTWTVESAPSGQAARFETGDILFGKLRPYFHKVGVAPIAGRCSTEILVLRASEPELFGVVVGHTASKEFIDHCVAISRGTRMPRAEWSDARRYPIAVPPTGAAREFNNFAMTAYSKIRSLVLQSRTLASVRDLLLPKLMSGELRVPDTADDSEVIEPIAEELMAL